MMNYIVLEDSFVPNKSDDTSSQMHHKNIYLCVNDTLFSDLERNTIQCVASHTCHPTDEDVIQLI